uniref:Uncharacterized protein n=1 Tax=Neogobius melanostomus TaxID=47308 RepID=A0A8C6THH1_9GOBI
PSLLGTVPVLSPLSHVPTHFSKTINLSHLLSFHFHRPNVLSCVGSSSPDPCAVSVRADGDEGDVEQLGIRETVMRRPLPLTQRTFTSC